jgi:chromosome segregation ATPase
MADNPKKEEKDKTEENESSFVALSNSLTQIFKDFYDSQVTLTTEHEALTKDISSLDENYANLSKDIAKLNKDVLDSIKELKKVTETDAKKSSESLGSLNELISNVSAKIEENKSVITEQLKNNLEEMGRKLDETNNSSLQALEVNKEELIQNIGILKEFIGSNVETMLTEVTNTRDFVQEQTSALPVAVDEVLQQMKQDFSARFEKLEKDFTEAMEPLNERVDNIKTTQDTLTEHVTKLHSELATSVNENKEVFVEKIGAQSEIITEMNQNSTEKLGAISSEVEKLKIAYFDSVIGQFDGLSKRIGELETAINELNKRDATPPTELMSRLEEIERTILPRSDFVNSIEELTKDLSKQLTAIKVAMIRAFPEIESKQVAEGETEEGLVTEGLVEEVVDEEAEEEEEEGEDETASKQRRGRSRKTN